MLARSDIVDIFLKAIDSPPSAFGEGLRLPNNSRDGRLPSAFGEGLRLPNNSRDGRLPSAFGEEKASRRMFISDWELRRLHKPAEKSIHIPPSAIISPLSSDWLEYEGIEVIFDETGK